MGDTPVGYAFLTSRHHGHVSIVKHMCVLPSVHLYVHVSLCVCVLSVHLCVSLSVYVNVPVRLRAHVCLCLCVREYVCALLCLA